MQVHKINPTVSHLDDINQIITKQYPKLIHDM